jgi:uncharacterized membrane protein
MEKWLKTLEQKLSKKFKKEEVDEVISYYEEMMNDRLENGESIDDIIKSYHMATIERDMLVSEISKREVNSLRDLTKVVIQFFLILIATPLWIPIAVLYFVSYVIVFVFFIVSISIFVSGIAAIIYYIAIAFNDITSFLEVTGYLGVGLIVMAILSLVSLGFYRVSQWIAKNLFKVFVNFVKKYRGVK